MSPGSAGATTPIWELPDRERAVEGLDDRGAPDPAYAAALGLVSAPLGRRAAAAAIDLGVVLLLWVPSTVWSFPLLWRLLAGRITWYGFVEHPDMLVAVVVGAVSLLLTVLLLVAQLVMHGRWGLGLGKLAVGLRTVNVATLGRPGLGRVTARALVVWLPLVTVVGTPLVLLSPVFAREDRWRGWHDRVGRAWMVDVRRGLDPYDKKRMRIARKTVVAVPAASIRGLPSLATLAGDSSYRPGARTSAGVLGAARPHGADDRVRVGLFGLEPGTAPATSSGPRLGAYVRENAVLADPAAPPVALVAPATQATQATQAPLGIAPDERVDRRHRAARSSRRAAPSATGARVRTTSTADVAPDGPTPPPPIAPPDPPASRGPSRPAQAGLALLFDSGHRVPLSGPVVLGRAPAPVGDALPVAIADPESSMSKTHAVLRPTPAGVEVLDQGSLNGTAVVHDGVERVSTAGETVVATIGDTIRVGERTAQVLGS